MAENGITQLNEDNFTTQIQSGITLVDFFADWCGPCQMLSPVLEEVAGEMVGQAHFGKVDIDTSNKIAGDFHVTSVPTLILFKDGKEVNRLVGVRDAKAIKEFVLTAL